MAKNVNTQSVSMWSPLAFPAFKEIGISILITHIGIMILLTGAGWLMATISDSDTMVALLQSSVTVPSMFLCIFVGALADGYNRRIMMIMGHALVVITSFAMAIMTVADLMTPWKLLLLSFVFGGSIALIVPVWQASLGDLVPREQLTAAINLNSLAFNLMRSIGPAVGGVIVAVAGAAAAFIVNAVCFIPVIVSLVRWRPAEQERPDAREGILRSILTGGRYVANSPSLVVLISRALVFALGAVCINALLPLVARDLLQGTSIIFGLLLGSFGVGAIAGAFANKRIRDNFSNETIGRLATSSFAVSALIVAYSSSTLLSCLALVPAGASWLLMLSLFNMTIQLATPRSLVGRTLSIYLAVSAAGQAFGAWVWGYVSELYATPIALLGSAGVLLLSVFVGFRYPLPDAKVVNEPYNTSVNVNRNKSETDS